MAGTSRALRIAVVGGGPGGLYFACLAKQLDPERHITVWERNPPDDTYGFGVVFSDETLGGIEHADAVIHERMASGFARWDDIDVHYAGEVVTSGGHGFAAMSRRQLLRILRDRAADVGVHVHFGATAPPIARLRADYDLVVGADGVNSTVRTPADATFGATYENRRCRYIWFGTDKVFDAFTFDIRATPAGVMQVHAYPYDAGGSTLIVEMTDEVWQKAGFAASPAVVAPDTLSPGDSDAYAIERCQDIFGDLLGTEPGSGRPYRLVGNHSRWINFTTLRCERWYDGNVVLLGDAAHTAHFSIGSGTKLAMEDALALVACLAESPDLPGALAAYQAERQPVVVSTQRAAQASLEWFENLDQYVDQPPIRFAFNLLTRSRRVTYENLQVRDPEFVAAVDEWFATSIDAPLRPPMFHPIRLRGLTLDNRIVVSAMDMYSSTDGYPGDFHLVHLGSKALGGAGLVMTEMVCVSPTGRITPGCTGLWTSGQRDGWARIVSFVHAESPAKIGIQLGHSGRKGSTRLDVGGHGRTVAGRELAGGRAVGGAVPAGEPDPPRTVGGRDGDDPRRVRRGRWPGRRRGLRPPRAALRTRLPALVVPVATHKPAHRLLRRLDRRPLALSDRGFRLHPSGVARRSADERTDLGHRLGTGRRRRGRGDRDRADVRRPWRGRRRRIHRSGRVGGTAGLRSVVSGAVRRRDPQRVGPVAPERRRDRGRRDLLVRRREFAVARRPRRLVRTRPYPPI